MEMPFNVNHVGQIVYNRTTQLRVVGITRKANGSTIVHVVEIVPVTTQRVISVPADKLSHIPDTN